MRMKKETYDEVRGVVKERLSTVFLPPSLPLSLCVCGYSSGWNRS